MDGAKSKIDPTGDRRSPPTLNERLHSAPTVGLLRLKNEEILGAQCTQTHDPPPTHHAFTHHPRRVLFVRGSNGAPGRHGEDASYGAYRKKRGCKSVFMCPPPLSLGRARPLSPPSPHTSHLLTHNVHPALEHTPCRAQGVNTWNSSECTRSRPPPPPLCLCAPSPYPRTIAPSSRPLTTHLAIRPHTPGRRHTSHTHTHTDATPPRHHTCRTQ